MNAIAAMSNATLVSPTLKNIVTRSATRAWAILGTRKMAKIQARTEPAIAKYLLEPNTLQAIDDGFQSAIKQGFLQVVKDAEDIHSDWYEVASACNVPLRLVHGRDDKTNANESIRDFAADFPDKITLEEIAGGGAFLYLTHEDLYISEMKALAGSPPTKEVTSQRG